MPSMPSLQSVKAHLQSYTHRQSKTKDKAPQVDPPQENSAVLAAPLTQDAVEMSTTGKKSPVSAPQQQKHQDDHSIPKVGGLGAGFPDPEKGDIAELRKVLLRLESTIPFNRTYILEGQAKKSAKKAVPSGGSARSEYYDRMLYALYLIEAKSMRS